MKSSEALQGTGYTWGRYISDFIEEYGGWAALVDHLIRRAQSHVDISVDAQTVEKGLRRLAQREHHDGGQYGRWMLRFFGMPMSVHRWLAWMGQYHSRFFDLPTRLRHEQLQLWDRAPVTDSSLAIWVHLGQASLHLRRGDHEACEARLELIRTRGAPDEARVELALFCARLRSDATDHASADAELERAGELIDTLPTEPQLIYRARLLDQRAHRLLHPAQGPADVNEALELYASIEDTDALPFVGFRRAHGLAYCRWRLGEITHAEQLVRHALSCAGDGGFVRLRIMALNLLAHILDEPADGAHHTRAARLAIQIEDEDLRSRIALK